MNLKIGGIYNSTLKENQYLIVLKKSKDIVD